MTAGTEQNKQIIIKQLPQYMLSLSQHGIIQQHAEQAGDQGLALYQYDEIDKARRAKYNFEPNPATGENIFWTVNPFFELPVKIGIDPNCMSSRPPTTVLHQMIATVEKFGERLALSVKRDGKHLNWTWLDFYNDILTFARSAIYHGFRHKMGTSIIGFNSPEWVIGNLGTIFANGVAAGVYTTNNSDSAFYVADHSESFIIITEDQGQTEKFIQKLPQLQHAAVIIQYTGKLKPEHEAAIAAFNNKVVGVQQKKTLYMWDQFMAVGNDKTKGNTPQINAELQQRMMLQQPGSCCSLIYTSGTTGNPKAVMLSHDNLTWCAGSALCEVDICENDRFVSYLPLSHVAAQILDIYIPMITGASLTFATPNALKGELVETLQQVRPTVFFGVPRVWEKIYETMKELSKQNNAFKRNLILYAKSVGYTANLTKIQNSTGFFTQLPNRKNIQPEHEHLGYQYYFFKKMIFNMIKQQLGLDQTRFRATAAAPISKEILDFYISIDLPLLEIYGMSESTGPHTINFPHRQKLYSVGTPFPGAYMMLDNCTRNKQTSTAEGDVSNYDGEILMWGRHICMGYLKDQTNTLSTIDVKGYLHTGDVGRVDQYGFLSITGRIKELLITAGGENVAPVPIEDEIKANTQDIVSNVMVIGDRQKYLTAFVTLKCEELGDGGISTTLTESCVANIAAFQNEDGARTPASAATAAKTPESRNIVKILTATPNGDDYLYFLQQQIYSILTHGVQVANGVAVSNAAKVTKYVILPNDFSVANAELTPTMKLKRKVVLAKYESVMDLLYPIDPADKEANTAPKEPAAPHFKVIDVAQHAKTLQQVAKL